MKHTNLFRNFVNNLWYEHKDEIYFWEHKDPEYDLKEYFNRYRWWLRIEYRKQSMKGI